ncbi:hypothetical protein [Nocardioides donggukensis]|uniref:Uncharacterized protein n=1 Tax=Nocardioides donggukensis TaxID=2774019 RepID=A0A927Q2A3_9ACTN|nr:hypothetical protein [Nocardioides donggukensis]MBD8870194.1 hypothetical protein [Nocardioides donggukensis]
MSLLRDIWGSATRLPIAVLVWMLGILVPANLGILFFLGEPVSLVVAVLALGALAANGVVMVVDRGFSNAMALPHVALWVPLAAVLLHALVVRDDVTGGYAAYLEAVLVVNAISLVFDVRDSKAWLDGERATF